MAASSDRGGVFFLSSLCGGPALPADFLVASFGLFFLRAVFLDGKKRGSGKGGQACICACVCRSVLKNTAGAETRNG